MMADRDVCGAGSGRCRCSMWRHEQRSTVMVLGAVLHLSRDVGSETTKTAPRGPKSASAPKLFELSLEEELRGRGGRARLFLGLFSRTEFSLTTFSKVKEKSHVVDSLTRVGFEEVRHGCHSSLGVLLPFPSSLAWCCFPFVSRVVFPFSVVLPASLISFFAFRCFLLLDGVAFPLLLFGGTPSPSSSTFLCLCPK